MKGNVEWCQDLGSEQSLRDESSQLFPSSTHGFLSLPSDKPAVSPSTSALLKKRQSCRDVSNAQHLHGGDAEVLRECQAPPGVSTGCEKSPCPCSRSELLLEEEIMKCLQGLKVEWKSGLGPPTEVLGLR